ncbi:MAG: hypothetical protein IJH34_02345 [Romboutsia sp.]|nr:hypothetical protein [Romboutsia sp.]
MKQKMKKIVLPLLMAFMVLSYAVSPAVEVYANNNIPAFSITNSGVSGEFFDDNTDKISVFDKILKEYRTVVMFLSAIGTISMIMFFIFNFISLGKSQGNPSERQKAITGLIITGLASAGLGSVTLITTLFYNMIGSEDATTT